MQRFVVGGDDDDALLGDGVTAAILLGVVPDQRAARDQHVAVDDRPADPRVAADSNARHQNALLDVTEAVDPDVGAQHAAHDAAAGHDAAGRDDRSRAPGRSAGPSSANTNFAGRRLRLIGP